MLEWLQTILEGAAVTDGKLDVTAVMNTVKTQFPRMTSTPRSTN